MADLHFDGSVWCNIDIALCHLETIYKLVVTYNLCKISLTGLI
jgi:hypothetical protein